MTLTVINATRTPTAGAIINRCTVSSAGRGNETTTEDADLIVDGPPGRQRYFGNFLQWAARDKNPNPLNEGLAAALTDQKPEWSQYAADLIAEINTYTHQLSPRGEQGANHLAVYALDRDLAIPASPNDLRQAACVVSVGLVQLQR